MAHYPLITIVGGSGFVGRHVVKLLASEGYRIRVLVRDCVAADYLKTAGTPGQIVLEHADITRPQTLSGKLAGSDAVVNLVSIAYECGRQKFKSINVTGAAAIAAEAKKAGARAFVQISALGADTMTDTNYGKTKRAGEEAVRAAFPQATILRPSLIVGPEDHFFQRFARMSMIAPFLPLIGGGKTKFQPVLVTDVAKAILASIKLPEAAGNTYELTGPTVASMRGLLELMGRITRRKLCFLSIPSGIAKLKAFFFELLPFPPLLTRDQVALLRHDNIATAGAPGLAALGIHAGAIEDALPAYLSRFVKE